MRMIFVAPLFVLAMAAGIAAQAEPAAERAEAARMDPALGAIRVSADWKQTVFVLTTERERTVVATPAPIALPHGIDGNWEPPPEYGPVGFWMELKPGRYELIAANPGKQLARAVVEVTAGKEVWLNAKLEPDQSRIRMTQPLDKIGPTLTKKMRMEMKIDVKYSD